MFIAKKLGFLIFLVLVGCSTVEPYVPPVNGPVAIMQVRSQIVGGQVQISTFDDNLSCVGKKRIASNMQQGVSTLQSDTQLHADQYVTLLLEVPKAPRMNAWCRVLVSFRPKDHHIYQIRPAIKDGYCYLPVWDVTNPYQPVADRTIVKRALNNSFASSQGICLPQEMADSSRSSEADDKKASDMTLDDFKNLMPKE